MTVKFYDTFSPYLTYLEPSLKYFRSHCGPPVWRFDHQLHWCPTRKASSYKVSVHKCTLRHEVNANGNNTKWVSDCSNNTCSTLLYPVAPLVEEPFQSSCHVLDTLFAPGLLVVSSSEASPTEQFLKLSQEQHRIQHSGEYANPKWFIPNTLKYYVLLHDMSDGDEQKYVTACWSN